MKIYWTKKSKSRFQEIEQYIEVEFGLKAANLFKNRVFNFLQILSKFPGIGSIELPDKAIYGFQISKQTRLFYRIKSDRIILLTFFDARQDPKNRPK